MKRLIVIGLSALALCCLPERVPPGKQPDPELLRLHGRGRRGQVDAAMARDMIGAYRGNNGLGPLTLDPDLQAAAQAEADAMARADKPSSADAFKARLAADGLHGAGREPLRRLSHPRRGVLGLAREPAAQPGAARCQGHPHRHRDGLCAELQVQGLLGSGGRGRQALIGPERAHSGT